MSRADSPEPHASTGTRQSNGLFESFVNSRAYRPGPEDRQMVEQVTSTTRGVIPRSQVRWAGSQRKGTAIIGSDLDLCVESGEPVSERARRELRATLERDLGRPARVLSHAIRLPAQGSRVKVDIAFSNAAFGSRPLPAPAPFHDRRARQAAARALKLWIRSTPLPHLPGWVVEALVIHLDASGIPEPLDLFLRVITWLDERATPQAIEGVLRPAAFPRWDPQWSRRLPGRLQAVRNQARALRSRRPFPQAWRDTNDVGRWLGQ